jgi:exopolysaccharide production protein ExoZ
MSDRQSHRYELLDATRGIAAIGVLLFHSYAGWGHHQSIPLLRWVVDNGWRGVQIFFVVSGYCVAERLVKEHACHGSAQRFLLDRVWRIAPPYWAAAGLALLLAVAAFPFNGKPVFSDMIGTATFAKSIARLGEIGGLIEPWLNKTPFLIVSWTLSFEIMFYGIAAFGLAAANLTGQMSLSFIAGLLLAFLGLFPAVGSWCPILSLWPQFFLGMVSWWLVNRPPHLGNRLLAPTAFFCATVAISYIFKPAPGTSLGLAALVGWLIVVLHPFDRALSRVIWIRWAGSVGLWSYSLYLIHVPIVSKSRNLLGRWFEHSPIGFLLPPLCGLLAMGTAWYFYTYVEAKSEAYRKRLLPKWWPREAPNAVTPVPPGLSPTSVEPRA